MSFIPDKIFRAIQRGQLEPILVLDIEGAYEKFSTTNVKKILNYGAEDAIYGQDLDYGGFINLSNVKPYLDDDGSSLGIKQTLETDKGRSSTVTTLSLKVIDKNGRISKLISPGQELEDVLYRKARLWISFGQTSSFSGDFQIIFRGNISSVFSGSGFVTFEISSPDQKKRTALFPKYEGSLTQAVGFADTSIQLDSTDGLIQKRFSPGFSIIPDNTIRTAILLDSELIEYESIVGNIITGCSRAIESTSQSNHNDLNTTVESFYVIEGNCIDIALKLMLSDSSGTPYLKEVSVSSVNYVQSGDLRDNTLIVPDIDLIKEHNVQIGDYLSGTSFTNSSNNISNVLILDVYIEGTRSFVQVDYNLTTTLTEESGQISIISKYNTLPDGLAMVPDEVDIDQHEFIRDTFLSAANLRFYIKDTIENMKDFIGQELFKPYSAFELPRFSRSSIGFHSPPIPNGNVLVLSQDTILNSKNLVLKRRISKNFYNSVIYKFEDSVNDDKFLRSEIPIDTDSLARVPIGNKPLVIESKGMRIDLNARTLAKSSAQRLLNKYKFGAEYIDNIEVNFKTGFQIEIGSSVILDPEGLKITDTTTGLRNKGSSLFQVVNKNIELKNGKVQLSIEDANFNLSARYGLYSPSSRISSVIDSKTFFIEQWQQDSEFGASEYRKWIGLLFKNQETRVVIRSIDFDIYEYATIESISFNKITLKNSLSITNLPNYWIELATYDEQTSQNIKLVYTHLNETNFPDGTEPYVYL